MREDPDVSDVVAQRFRAEGIDLRLEHQPKRCLMENNEKILIAEEMAHGGEEVRIRFDELLVAVGRSADL